ncbi:hypothetical protein LUZ60_008627 [Juncus effusus]|nr:hypothetical protein LUZ60_008627 [Juncus effusus]
MIRLLISLRYYYHARYSTNTHTHPFSLSIYKQQANYFKLDNIANMESETSKFNSRPSLRWDQPGSATPPPQKPGSVPFLWEEKPGKPKKSISSADGTGPLSSRSLKLPPRLVAEMKGGHHVDSDDSPTTVLDGPDLVNVNPTSLELVPCHSFSSRVQEKKKKPWFWRRKKDEKEEEENEKKEVQYVSRLRRNRSLMSVPSLHGSSHFWACIRKNLNLKQVILWRKYH